MGRDGGVIGLESGDDGRVEGDIGPVVSGDAGFVGEGGDEALVGIDVALAGDDVALVGNDVDLVGDGVALGDGEGEDEGLRDNCGLCGATADGVLPNLVKLGERVWLDFFLLWYINSFTMVSGRSMAWGIDSGFSW